MSTRIKSDSQHPSRLLIGLLRITLHQLNGEIFVVQFMHNALTVHQVVDEQESFHCWKKTPFHRLIATAWWERVAHPAA